MMKLTVAVTTGRRGGTWYSVTIVALTKRRRVGTGYIATNCSSDNREER